MPYRRTYRKRPYRKRPYKKKYGYFGQAGNDAQKALRMAGKALALINPEHKYNDINGTLSPTTTASIGNIFAPTQGDGATSRDGDSIKVTDLMLHSTLFRNQSSTQISTLFRLIIGIDTQPNGASPAATDVLQVADVYGFRNLSYGTRFQILYDHLHHVADNDNPSKTIDIYKKLSQHMEFKSNVGSVADLSTTAFFYLIVSDEATNAPQWNYRFRFRWLDN